MTEADGERVPALSVLVHQGEQQCRVDSPTEQQADGHVAEEVPFYRFAIELQELPRRFLNRAPFRKRRRFEAVPAREARSGWIDHELRAWRQFPDASIQRSWCRRVAIFQKEIHGHWIELARLFGPDQRSYF